MKNIENINLINKKKISEEFYFQSLLEEAYDFHMITDNDIERIQYECLELLAHKTEEYNGGDSSSIRVEAAKSIMTSNLYTIGIWLKTYPSADDAVTALRESKIAELYSNGRKRIDTMMKTTRMRHYKVMDNILGTDNVFYNETIVDGIKGFFKIYNPDFDAHEIHITADYPLLVPVKSLVGIEFIQKYLESIYFENMFCRNFLPEDIHHLLCGYDKAYQELPFNLYEHVLTAAVGCILTDENVHRLAITEDSISRLNSIFKGKSTAGINTVLLSALTKARYIFPPTGSSQEQYIKTSLQTIASRIRNAVELHTLDKVFYKPKYPENDPKLFFTYGNKMDNELYRKILSEIAQCRYMSDKISIIKKQIHSLADLEDILLDADLSADEITCILRELRLPEIAALLKKYPKNPDIEAVEWREQELLLSKSLHGFIALLSDEQKAWLTKMC